MGNINGDSSWSEWSKYILKTLEAQATDINTIKDAIQEIKVEIAMLQVKSSAWGAAGALIVVLLAKFVKF